MNRITEIRQLSNLNKTDFAKRYNIPYRTLQDWESGRRECPIYVAELLEKAVRADYKGEIKMKRLFVETNGFNTVVFVDGANMAYSIDCETLEQAKAMDYSGIEGCETAEEIDTAIGAGKGTFDFMEIEADGQNRITEF